MNINIRDCLGKAYYQLLRDSKQHKLPFYIVFFTVPTVGTRAFNSKHIKECIAKLLYNCSQTYALFQINGKILKDKKSAFYSFALGQ